MPRPRLNPDGSIVDQKDLRKLWVICKPWDLGVGEVLYLYRDGRFGADGSLAATWHEHEKAMAEDVAASVVLSEPGTYLGSVDVVQVLG